MKIRPAWFVLTLAALSGGCGSSSNVSKQPPQQQIVPKFAYVANATTFADGYYSVSGFAVNPHTGVFAPMSGPPFPAGKGPMSIVVDPSNHYVYVSNRTDFNVSAYSIDNMSGSLTPLPGSPFPAGYNPGIIAIHPNGRLLFVPNINVNNPDSIGSITVYTIASTGILTPVSGSPFPAGSGANAVAVDRTGKYLFACNGSSVFSYLIDANTGKLTPSPKSPFSGISSAYDLATDSTSDYLYVTNVQDNTLSGFHIDPSTGDLEPLPGSPFAVPGKNPASLAISHSGRLLFVGHELSADVAGFSIDPQSGVPTPLAGSPFQVDGSPHNSIAFDPQDRFLYIANSSLNSISAFQLSGSGDLIPILGSPFGPTGAAPVAIAISSALE